MITQFPNKIYCLIGMCLILANSSNSQIVPGEGLDSGLGGNNIISGTVYSPGGTRLTRRVQVRLTTMTRGDRVSSTDDNGNFIFRGVPSGNYTVVIDKEKEYEQFRQAVDIIQLRGMPPQTMTLNIRLSEKVRSDVKPGLVDSRVAGLPKEGVEMYRKAVELAKAGDHKAAVEQLIKCTVEYPKFMPAFNDLGVEYLKLNDLEKADVAFAQAVAIESDNFMPLMNRGIVLVNLKRYQDAEAVMRKAVKINNASPAAHYFLGQALANLGSFPEAEKELSIAIKTGGPEMKEALRIRAILYNVRGEKLLAAGDLETYLKLAPNAPDAETLRTTIAAMKDQSTASPTKP